MHRHLSIALCLFLPLVLIAQDSQPQPTSSEWRQNLDDIGHDIRAFHPSPFTKIGELTFMREMEAMKDAIPNLSEEQRVVRAMRLVASVGDGHTQMEPASPRFAWWYPFRLYEFTDGYFITSAHPSVRELAGAQVLEIAGHPVRRLQTKRAR